MAEDFKIIESQEQLDSVIKARLEREDAKHAKQLAEIEEKNKQQLAEAQKQIGELTEALNTIKESAKAYDEQIAERDAKIKDYELRSIRTQTAHELGLSFEAVDFLKGDDPESIRASAEALKSLVGQRTTPLANPDTTVGAENKTESAYMSMVRDLTRK